MQCTRSARRDATCPDDAATPPRVSSPQRPSLASLGLSDSGLELDYKAPYLVEQSAGGVGEQVVSGIRHDDQPPISRESLGGRGDHLLRHEGIEVPEDYQGRTGDRT